MRIAVIAPGRHPIIEPYAGGLEAYCAILVKGLRARGHEVDLYAAAGSEGNVREFEFPTPDWRCTDVPETDHTYPPGHCDLEDRAFARLRAHLESSNYDVVHNNSLHPELLLSTALPLVTTLHCPPVERMAAVAPESTSVFTAVSDATAASWGLPDVHVIPNAADLRVWREGPGGQRAIWFGRIVPEKAPHMAIDACRLAGIPLTIVGRRANPVYWAKEIAPRMGEDVEWIGTLNHTALAERVRHSRVAVITPDWDEPFGLVSIEAMACGTPVAAFARGGLADVLDHSPCPSVPAGDVQALARAIADSATVNRAEVARYARGTYGLDAFLDRYLAVYRGVSITTPTRVPDHMTRRATRTVKVPAPAPVPTATMHTHEEIQP